MKRCPECRRDYYDDSLLYCLDDGSALLEGPRSFGESATAILPEPRAVATGLPGGGSPARSPVDTQEQTAIFSGGKEAERQDSVNAHSERQSLSAESSPKRQGVGRGRLWVAVCLAALVLAGGYFGYRYFAPTRHIESIAVMPFVNESGNADIDYLSDGMTEALISSLSQVPNLNVKARSTVFRYVGKETHANTVGKELNVQALLNGRVVQRGQDLILYVELVDAQTENSLWKQTYNKTMTNLVSLQNDIARDVADKLKVKLSGLDEQKLAKKYTENPEAYQLYLRGRFHVFKLTPPEVNKGIAYFQQAIEIDPNYALAYSGISDAYRSLGLGAEMLPAAVLPRANAAARKAIEIDDALSEGHIALGSTLFWEWNWGEAEAQFKLALELNSNNSEVHQFYAHLLSNAGRHPEALAEIKRAREIDPLSPFVNALEGQFLLHAGQTEQALDRLQKTFELAPNFWMPHLFASGAYIEKGMYVDAVTEARKARELSPVLTISTAYESYALARSGRLDEARVALETMLQLSATRFVPPCHIALAYTGLGETDKAFEWLERGYDQRDPKMTFLKVDPKWNDLRDDPRFKALIIKVGFPE